MKIMIVDDAIFMRHMLSGIFEKAGHSVCGMAANGSEAIERFAELKPDLVTMDIIMPDMNGVVALKEIKKIDPDVNVLIISALGHKSLISEAVKAGAAAYVIKPFKPEQILEAVEQLSVRCDT